MFGPFLEDDGLRGVVYDQVKRSSSLFPGETLMPRRWAYLATVCQAVSSRRHHCFAELRLKVRRYAFRTPLTL